MSDYMEKCPWCGKEFDFEEVSNAYAEHYDYAFDYMYTVGDPIGLLCLECAIEFTERDVINDDDDSFPPPGCRECGGDYPRCISSCSIMND